MRERTSTVARVLPCCLSVHGTDTRRANDALADVEARRLRHPGAADGTPGGFLIARGQQARRARTMRHPRRNTRVWMADGAGSKWLCPCVLGLIVLASCGGKGVLDPPPPELQPDVVVPPGAPPSTISVARAFPVSLLSELLEEAVPTTYGTMEEMRVLPARGRTNVSFALERGPFGVTLLDDEARVAATVRYALRLSYGLPALPDPGGSCGMDPEQRPSLAVVIRSRVSLDPQWSLRTDARLSDVRAASVTEIDRCEVSLLGLDVTDQIVEGVRTFIESHLAAIDDHAAEVDTRSRFEEWWRTLQEPIELDDALWLSMGPQSIRRGPVRGSGDSVRVELALTARPRIVYGLRPSEPLRPLPALDTGAG